MEWKNICCWFVWNKYKVIKIILMDFITLKSEHRVSVYEKLQKNLILQKNIVTKWKTILVIDSWVGVLAMVIRNLKLFLTIAKNKEKNTKRKCLINNSTSNIDSIKSCLIAIERKVKEFR